MFANLQEKQQKSKLRKTNLKFPVCPGFFMLKDIAARGIRLGLLFAYKILKQKNKDVFISNPTRSVEKIFNMSGMFEIMPKIS